MMEEIKNYVNYLNGICKEYQKLELIDIQSDFFKARSIWDAEFYAGPNQSYREEKFVDKDGSEWYLLLEEKND